MAFSSPRLLSRAIRYVFKTLRLRQAAEVDVETLDEGHEGAFQDFPPEIIQEILLHVLPNSIIPFALTCKRNHEISLPILNRQVTLTDATLHSFYSSKIATHDPSLVWVRDVKFTGTQMYPAPSTGMDNAAFASLFSSLPLLQALDIGAHRWQFGGWSGFQAAIQSLPTTMESLVAKVRSLDDTTAWDQRGIFPSYRRLDIKIYVNVIDAIQQCTVIPANLGHSFPNLTHLSITMGRNTPWGIDSFFRQSHFPSLQALTLDVSVLPYDAKSSFVTFIARHSSSLSELNAPTDFGLIPREDMERLSTVPLRLEKLFVNITLFHTLALYLKDCDILLPTVKISQCFHPCKIRVCNLSLFSRFAFRAFNTVHTLTMSICLNLEYPKIAGTGRCITSAMGLPLELEDLKRMFPNLRSLYIEVPMEVKRKRVLGLLRKHENHLAACHALTHVFVVGYDGFDTFSLRAGGKFGVRKLRRDLET